MAGVKRLTLRHPDLRTSRGQTIAGEGAGVLTHLVDCKCRQLRPS